MPLCGFNEKMLEGLKEFHECLIEKIKGNSEEENNVLRI
mgnify:CR=1 FL=1